MNAAEEVKSLADKWVVLEMEIINEGEPAMIEITKALAADLVEEIGHPLTPETILGIFAGMYLLTELDGPWEDFESRKIVSTAVGQYLAHQVSHG